MKLNKIINLKELKKWLEKNFGKRCRPFAKNCPCCEAWKLYDNIENFYCENEADDYHGNLQFLDKTEKERQSEAIVKRSKKLLTDLVFGA